MSPLRKVSIAGVMRTAKQKESPAMTVAEVANNSNSGCDIVGGRNETGVLTVGAFS